MYEGVELPVLAAGVDARREVGKKLFVVTPSGEGGVSNVAMRVALIIKDD